MAKVKSNGYKVKVNGCKVNMQRWEVQGLNIQRTLKQHTKKTIRPHRICNKFKIDKTILISKT